MSLYRIVPSLILCAFLTGCGFKPLNKSFTEDKKEIVTALSHVKIDYIPNRTGQELHNHLLTLLSPTGAPIHPKYILSVRLKENKVHLGILKDAPSSRTEFTLTAIYVLKDQKTDKPIASKSLTATSNFNTIVGAPYATVVAAEDAKAKTLRQIAQDIKLQIAVDLQSYQQNISKH